MEEELNRVRLNIANLKGLLGTIDLVPAGTEGDFKRLADNLAKVQNLLEMIYLKPNVDAGFTMMDSNYRPTLSISQEVADKIGQGAIPHLKYVRDKLWEVKCESIFSVFLKWTISCSSLLLALAWARNR
jgi:hypothetical protein